MLPLRTALRLLVSLLAICAWSLATNHCAFARLTTPTIAAEPMMSGYCPAHSAPQKNDKEPATRCCKTFPPAAFTAVKNLLAANDYAIASQIFFAESTWMPVQTQLALRPLEFDTGPPFAFSFVESVLQRSLLAHAPPSFA